MTVIKTLVRSKPKNPLHDKIIDHLIKYRFIFVNNPSTFSFGPTGLAVLDNVRREWYRSYVQLRDSEVYLVEPEEGRTFPGIIDNVFRHIKSFYSPSLPLSLVLSKGTLPPLQSDGVLNPETTSGLRCLDFVNPKEGQQIFCSWQQYRRRWWRCFSAEPGRFRVDKVEEPREDAVEEVEIVAEFPWGDHKVETISYFGDSLIRKYNYFSVSVEGKRVLPHLIDSHFHLERATFTYLCDSIHRIGLNSAKSVCEFHRKFAPFQFSLVADASVLTPELKELADVLCLQLKKKGLTTLFIRNEFGRKKLKFQLEKSDSLGIPYSLVLGSEALNTGIFGLRSRDTTLEEDVHVGTFVEYAVKIMQNY